MLSSNYFLSLLLLITATVTTTKGAEYYICGTTYMNAKKNCRTNPRCIMVEKEYTGTPPGECPEETPTCFTIISTAEKCGDDNVTATTTPPASASEISEPLLNNETIPEEGGEDTATKYASKLANNLILSIQMNANFDHAIDCASYQADWALCYSQYFTFRYTGTDEAYTDNNFYIYFSSIHRLLYVDHPDFEYQHVMGDLTYIKPTASFKGFEAESEVTLTLVFEYWSVQETDNMPRFFVVDSRDNSTAVIANTDTENLNDFVMPYTSSKKTEADANVPMTAENRYARNIQHSEGADTDTSTRIIPTPFRTEVRETAQTFEIYGVSLIGAHLLGLHQSGAEDLIGKILMKPSSTNDYAVSLVIGTLSEDIAGTESYTMDIKAQGTTITASHAQGLFYGVMSFIGLLDISKSSGAMPINEMMIHDKPRFAYRGNHIDVARNFQSKESLMRTIDAMALYKLNNLHLGLSNDEAWRLEIPGIEELTSVGSKRCFDLTEETCLLTQLGSGPDASDELQFYTVADFVEILQYSKARNVKIAPEFNMPGHARAAVISMEARAKKGDDSLRLMDPEDETQLLTVQFYDRSSIINPCLDSSVRFVVKLVDEVVKMYAEAQQGLEAWQFGGDEAKNILLGPGFSDYNLTKEVPFSRSPACIKKMKEDPTIGIDTVEYWALTVNKILAQKGVREMIAWGGLNGLTKEDFKLNDVSVNFWSTLFWGAVDDLINASKADFGIIMANPDYLYFDFPYEVHPEERGYYWGARENSVAKVFSFAPENLPQNAETSVDRDGAAMNITTPDVSAPVIKGMQGQIWSETVRNEAQHHEMTFPRVLALAERAWHRGNWELDWTPTKNYHSFTDFVPKDELAMDFKGFNTVLGCREVSKIWQRLGIVYRVPPPGAKVEAGMLTANTELPCTQIQYSIDEGETWQEYLVPVDIGEGKVVLLKSLSSDGGLESRVVSVDQEECLSCPGVCESNPLMPFNTPQICTGDESSSGHSVPFLESKPTPSPSAKTSCKFCEGSMIDVTVVPPETGGRNCGELQEIAANHNTGDGICNTIQSVESKCCPESFVPCAFCEGSMIDVTVVLPEVGGQNCGELQEIAANHNTGDGMCNTIQSVESKCCPESFVPCAFCEGSMIDVTVVLPEVGGQNCGELQEIAANHNTGDGMCNTIQSVESKCCPESFVPCAFCEGSMIDVTVVLPEVGGQNCGELREIAVSHKIGDSVCSTIQFVESKCCPSLINETILEAGGKDDGSTNQSKGPTPSPTAVPIAILPVTSSPTTLIPVAPETTTVPESEQVIALYKNPEGNKFFCGDMFSTIMHQCLRSKPCPGGLSGVCDDNTSSNIQGCFKAPECTAEYKAAGATSTEEYNIHDEITEKCRICGESEIHSEATVFFEGEEFLCREFDGVFDEGRRDAESPSCKLAKELYSDICCIKSDVPNAVPSPTVLDEGEYPTLWILEHPTSSDIQSSADMLVSACAIILSFVMMYF